MPIIHDLDVTIDIQTESKHCTPESKHCTPFSSMKHIKDDSYTDDIMTKPPDDHIFHYK